jgi:carbon-monoxide dehydrogenase medium subunit
MKPVPSFHYHRPTSVEEAVELLGSLDNAKPFTGGTDLVPLLREGVVKSKHLVDLNQVAELNYVRMEGGFICIGAATTYSQVIDSPIIKEKAHALYDAVSRIGSPQIRNLGTITGNVCNASPAADAAPPLLVLDAEVTIGSVDDRKQMPISGLFAGPKINTLGPNELVTEIRFPVPPTNSGSAYRRIARRKAFTLSVVGAAAYMEMDGEICSDVRVAFGSVAETSFRVETVEELLRGKEPTPELMERVCEACKGHVRPITDIRGTAEYRRDMCAVLLKRAMDRSLEVAKWER